MRRGNNTSWNLKLLFLIELWSMRYKAEGRGEESPCKCMLSQAINVFYVARRQRIREQLHDVSLAAVAEKELQYS